MNKQNTNSGKKRYTVVDFIGDPELFSKYIEYAINRAGVKDFDINKFSMVFPEWALNFEYVSEVTEILNNANNDSVVTNISIEQKNEQKKKKINEKEKVKNDK